MLSQDFKEFVELLIKNKAEYLIVGGYAVGVNGHPRYTGDLNIWLRPSVENARRVFNCVNEFGFGKLGISESDFTKEGNIIQLGYPPHRIDLLTSIDGVGFDDCFAKRKVVEIEELQVNFIGYEDLIKNKKATGRPRDIDEIEHLK
ncbi:MAG TPA: hypothetical protein PL029_00415 [Bacteroidia bacterium]|nr:hypothetical protein [Bacteroidia bacterium]